MSTMLCKLPFLSGSTGFAAETPSVLLECVIKSKDMHLTLGPVCQLVSKTVIVVCS